MEHKLIIEGSYLFTENKEAHLPLNGANIIENLPLLPPIENDNVYELSEKDFIHMGYKNGKTDFQVGFVRGYNKAKEKYKFTEEDVIKIVEKSRETGLTAEYLMLSIQQPKMPVRFECEMEVIGITDDGNNTIKEPKTTTNSQGQTVWVGKYIYETNNA